MLPIVDGREPTSALYFKSKSTTAVSRPMESGNEPSRFRKASPSDLSLEHGHRMGVYNHFMTKNTARTQKVVART